MGGRSYFCDYCCCFMKNDINVRKKHNEGLAHTVAKTTYMRRFELPHKLLAEESAKIPCSRYWKGYCKFQLFCQFGHYDAQQLAKLGKIVERLKRKKKKPRRKRSKLEQVTLRQSKGHKSLKNLPPSLSKIDFNRLRVSALSMKTTWG